MATACRLAAPACVRTLQPPPRPRRLAVAARFRCAGTCPRSARCFIRLLFLYVPSYFLVLIQASDSQETPLPGHCCVRLQLSSLDSLTGRRLMKREEKILVSTKLEEVFHQPSDKDMKRNSNLFLQLCALPCCVVSWLSFAPSAHSAEGLKIDLVYEVGELFELGIQLSYLLTLLGLLGAGTFFVIRQVLVRRELDLSAKELQEQVRSGDASATEYFELGAVMLRRKFYPAAIKYLQQAIQKWDRDEQDLAQVYNALGVSYIRDNKLDKAIQQFEKAVQLQPGYVTAWNNLGDAYEQKKDLKSALRAFEEVLLFDPNNKVARPRRDDLRERVRMYKGVSVKSEK